MMVMVVMTDGGVDVVVMVMMIMVIIMTDGEVDAHIDITGRLEDGWRFPFNEAVVVKGRLGHRCDVVVPVSAELL